MTLIYLTILSDVYFIITNILRLADLIVRKASDNE